MGSYFSQPTYHSELITVPDVSSLPENMESAVSSFSIITLLDYRLDALAALAELDLFNSDFITLPSDIARIRRILSYKDTFRLLGMEAIYVSNRGKLLAFSDENSTFSLLETVGNGFVPSHAMFPAPYSSLIGIMWVISRERVREMFDMLENDPLRGELSTELSKYIWPLDQDAIHVQFRSPLPSFRPSHTKLKVVFGNNEGGNDDEYCLAACNDGTVKWLPSTQCGNGNHVWTVHLFDPPSDGEVHLSQRLKRRGPNVQSGVVMNTQIGGNFSGPRSTQIIGSASVHMS